MTLDLMGFNEITESKMAVVEMPIGRIILDKMTIDEMPLDKMTCGPIVCSPDWNSMIINLFCF
jgi:hypothetical protein